MKKSAIVRIVIWSLVIALLLGFLAVGLGYRSYRRNKRDLWSSMAATTPVRSATEEPRTAAAAWSIDVYSTPNNQSTVMGTLQVGDDVTIGRTENISGQQWSYVTSPVTGWVMTQYLNTPDSISVPADEVRKISVDWAAGEITVKAAEVSEIRFSESGGDGKHPMVWKLRDGKLDIDCYENDLSFGLFHFDFEEKDLTILVPKDWICEELDLDTASTNIQVSGLTVREVDIDSASGICKFQNCSITDLDVDTASGDVFLEGTLDTLDFDAASAQFTGVLYNTPSRIDLDSASGDLDLTLPQDTGFTVKLDGMSNRFTSDFPTTARNGSHVCGDGRCLIEVDGMSSGVVIRRSTNLPVTEASPTEASETKSPLPPEAPTAPDAPTAPEAPTVP